MTSPNAPAPASDKLDGAVLKIASVVVLGGIMSILDVTRGERRAHHLCRGLRNFVRHRRVDDDGLHPRFGDSHSGYRLGCRPFRHQAPLHDGPGALRARFGRLCDGVGYHLAHRLPCAPGPRRRHVDAARYDDHDPGRRSGPCRSCHGSSRYPDAARSYRRPDSRWLADRGRELALDLPDQLADRHHRSGCCVHHSAVRQGEAFGVLRLPRHDPAVARPGAVPVRCVVHP